MSELPTLIFILVINAFAIVGFNRASEFDTFENGEVDPDSRMILWKFRHWSLKHFGKFWSKPICTCPTCMASLHSAYVYFFFLAMTGFSLQWILFYPIYILALAGLSNMVNSLAP